MNKTATFLALALVCALVALFLLGMRIVEDGDAIQYFYPYAALHVSGGGSLWSGSILFGVPIAASFQYGFFSPLFRAAYGVLGSVGGYAALIVLLIAVAGLLTYRFARVLGLSRSASFFVASCYALGQFSTHWLSNISVIGSISVLPALMLGVWGSFHRRFMFAVVGMLATGIALLGAHQQFVFMALVVSAVYTIVLTTDRYRQDSLRAVFAPIAGAVGMVLGGFLIALPQLIYTVVFSPLSTRVGGLSWSQASVESATPLDLIKFVLPHFSFRYGISAEFLPYIGIFGLVFVVIAILKMYRSNVEVRFFTVLSVILLLTTFKYSPLFWLVHQVPVLDYFRGPARWTLALNFTMAILAGYGMQWAIENWAKFKNIGVRIAGRIFAVVAGVGAVSSVVFILFGDTIARFLQGQFDTRMYADTTKLPLEYYHTLIQNIVNNSFANFYILNDKFLIALFSIGTAYAVMRFSKTINIFSLSALVVTFLSLLVAGFSNLSFANSDVIEKTPPTAEFILSREKSSFTYRTFNFLSGMASSQKISAINSNSSKDAILYGVDSLMPNSGLFWGIPTADGYEPMAPRRGQQVLAYIGSEVNQRFLSLANYSIPLPDKLELFTSRLSVLSMLNVKYIISAYELPKTDGLELAETFTSTRFEVPIYLYENRKVLPRVYLANAITSVSETDEEKNFTAIIESNTDFSKNTFIECADCSQYQNQSAKSDKIVVREYKDGYLNLTATVEKGRWLIFSESNLPGWKITIDGRPARSYMANYLFHGLYVPKGQHQIMFEYVGILRF